MISVIVPIYNVEQYLRQCIDSILAQTYTDLEIILVDDGSVDRSGMIAESYNDSRIHVFHTVNHGLSAARNIGIKESHGDYLFFLDSDDWIDSNLLEYALSHIGDSDILCFGYTDEIDNKIVCFHPSVPGLYNGISAFLACHEGKISSVTWNKLYRKYCFTSLRFPEGRICEDIATTYKLLLNSSSVVCIERYGCHHRIRDGSISNTHNLANITDAWIAVRDQYDYCMMHLDKEYQTLPLKSCAGAIIRAFAWKNTYSKSIPQIFYEMSAFVIKNYSFSNTRHYPIRIKVGLIFVRFCNPFSFWLLNRFLFCYRLVERKPMK